MYRVLFFCRNNPKEGWQGKTSQLHSDLTKAVLWAIAHQQGTSGTSIVQSPRGIERVIGPEYGLPPVPPWGA
jgi:hypothetical protein